MFKLKVSEKEREVVKDRLNLVETVVYDYVLTDDPDQCEVDKINIVFNKADISKISNMVDLIVRGEDKNVVGFNEFGQKSVESRNFLYFIVDGDSVEGVLSNAKLIIRMKLYEIEEFLDAKDFIRISKYCLVNIGKIEYIKPAINSKLDLLMKNGEQLEVNRGYYKSFKKALEI